MEINYREQLAEIIRSGGGTVEDGRFVTRPGVILMHVTEPTVEAAGLLDRLGLDADLEGCARVAAFDGRVTYLNFPESDERSGTEYLGGIVKGRGHTSVVARGYASVLFAGISLETVVELVAGRNGRSARLTSSDTKSQDDTLYCLEGPDEERAEQRRFVEAFLALRDGTSARAMGGRRARNAHNLTTRAALLHTGMCLEDWHGLFRGRLQMHGNEQPVREAFARACLLLHDRFPYVIDPPSNYGFEEALP